MRPDGAKETPTRDERSKSRFAILVVRCHSSKALAQHLSVSELLYQAGTARTSALGVHAARLRGSSLRASSMSLPAPYSATDKESFAYESTAKRLPVRSSRRRV